MRGYDKHLLITGTARSGTSWLAELMARQYRYRLLFEPEHETRTKWGHLICDRLIEHHEDSPDGVKYFKRVLANRVDSDWIAQSSNRKWKRHLWPFIPKRFIIKCVRAGLMAHFINASLGVPVLHVIRDPYQVIKSQKRSKFPWILNLSLFASQPKLVEFIKENYDLELNQLNGFNEEQLMAVRWCIENVAIFEMLGPYQGLARIIKYEDLVQDIELFRSLCKEFKLDPIADLDEHYFRPSTKTHPKSKIRKENEDESGLTVNDIMSISEVLSRFKAMEYIRRPDNNEN
ncbi:MAG: sulfotransferase family protein [Flavobacteriaceae bacterium]|nr:sulfotransferase family protein [Flavobacteriaceae bacterium]